jgi:hypothetical protein
VAGAIKKLYASMDQFIQTLEMVEEASQKATSPAVKSTLDGICGILEATCEQFVQTVLKKE